jgi:hypothetical protein
VPSGRREDDECDGDCDGERTDHPAPVPALIANKRRHPRSTTDGAVSFAEPRASERTSLSA